MFNNKTGEIYDMFSRVIKKGRWSNVNTPITFLLVTVSIRENV
ncbi:hypothetical protein C900_05738 [Fulvivirga imtechensis AK7]|uniref:Uncharacterized protein n=1 Tax=Fulvivirga imtechensis AK7 TaxID=1237149 RepID=L8JY55_9BACT|nr:hypothetical protein C900_05738 [Fulvivirga imtechensis AK7]